MILLLIILIGVGAWHFGSRNDTLALAIAANAGFPTLTCKCGNNCEPLRRACTQCMEKYTKVLLWAYLTFFVACAWLGWIVVRLSYNDISVATGWFLAIMPIILGIAYLYSPTRLKLRRQSLKDGD